VLTAVVALCKFSLFCSTGSQSKGLLSWLADDLFS